MRITTDHKWKQFRYRWDVPEKILQDDFDWLGDEQQDGFIYYKGYWYHLSQFMRVPEMPLAQGWEGVHNDSYFSGVLIRLSSDGEEYQIATYMS